jgi:YXWGXW repeat-containing protein
VKKTALAVLLGLILLPAASNAQVVVRIGPPAPVVEHYGPPPHEGWVWQPGYHYWDGNRYVWRAGVWAEPPRRHAVWVPHHWVHRHGGWVLVEGHWR